MSTSSQSTDSAEARAQLRTEAKALRASLPAAYRGHKSAEICKRLAQTLELTLGITGTAPDRAFIAVYAAFPEEVDLEDFIASCYEQGCRVAFPCMVRDAWGIPDGPGVIPLVIDGDEYAEDGRHITKQTMEMREVPRGCFEAGEVPFIAHPLKRFHHDDKELQTFPYVAADELTLAVVPVVAFDDEGNRLGYGAGNYDRYLAQVPAFCRTVGVAFAEQRVEGIPAESHDVKLAILSL